jgi:hypothetical protein
MSERVRAVLWVSIAALLGGCGSSSGKDRPPPPMSFTGGSTGTDTGGAPGTGGAVATGGVPGTGGAIGTGGSPDTGGASGTGGAVDAGTAVDTAPAPGPDAAIDTAPSPDAAPDAAVARDAGPDAALPRDASPDGPSPAGVVLELIDQSAGMTMATDAGGTIHVAASTIVDASGKYMAVYAKCSGQCTNPASWSSVTLAEVSTGHVPTIALTQDGRPRITYYVATGSLPGLHYLECDASCLNAGSWKDVRLANTLSTNPFPRPRLPFAVSPGGRAAFSYDDGSGLQLLYCTSNCGSGASWTAGMIAGVFIVPESLAFGSDQSLQLVARQRTVDKESLMFLDCSSDCTSAASWNGVTGLWQATGEIQALLARTAQGGSRIAAYADNPATSQTERVFVYLACDASCQMPASWKPVLLPPIAPDAASVGYALTLDGTGNPVLAYASDSASAVTRCTGDCTTTAGMWQTTAGLGAVNLNASFPITVPASCVSASWSFYTGPALTLAGGKALTALTASSKAFGGQCGTGSTAIETNSFVVFP